MNLPKIKYNNTFCEKKRIPFPSLSTTLKKSSVHTRHYTAKIFIGIASIRIFILCSVLIFDELRFQCKSLYDNLLPDLNLIYRTSTQFCNYLDYIVILELYLNKFDVSTQVNCKNRISFVTRRS